jgi:serine/threonine protein kinase
MGVVFRALDPSIGRDVAIKTIKLAEFVDAEQRAKQRERLFREARSAGILSHPNIVTIYDMAEQDDMAYIAMEFVAGATLEQLLSAKEPLPAERLFSILKQTAAGLDYAHRKGIIHRDIKPANIILNEAGESKIADFGIAKISAADQLTQTGLIVGTPNYMAPEQVQGKTVTGYADQYSLTVLAYEMLTGDKPFVAEQLTTLVYQIVCEPPPPAQRLNPTLGPQIEAVLQKGLSKLPEQRYVTCSEMVDALEAACAATPAWRSLPRGGSLNLPTMAEERPRRPESRLQPEPLPPPAAPIVQDLPPPRAPREEPAKRSSALPVLAALLVVGAVGGTVFYLNRPSTPAPSVSETPTQEAPVQQPTKQETPKPVETPAPPAAAPAAPTEPVEPAPAKQQATREEIPPRPGRVPTSVEIPVRSQPSGATVVLDELPGTACITPCLLKASIGDHTLTFNLPAFKTLTRAIKVKDGAIDLPVITLSQALGVLMIQSQPDGATITIDDKRWPSQTPTQISLVPGKYRLTVEKGDLKATQNVEVRDGDLKHLTVTLSQ